MAQFRPVPTDDPVLKQIQDSISSAVNELSREQGLSVIPVSAGTYRVTGSEDVLVCDTSNGQITVLLLNPKAKSKVLTIKKTGQGFNKVLVRSGDDSSTIDGQRQYELSQAYAKVTVVSDGRVYLVIG